MEWVGGIVKEVAPIYEKIIKPAITLVKAVGNFAVGNYVGGACGVYNAVNEFMEKTGN